MKKNLLGFVAAILAACIALPLYGQTSKSRHMLRQAVELHLAASTVSEGRLVRPEFVPSYWTMRNVEKSIALKMRRKDQITVGLMSIADNLGANDLSSEGVSWRDDDHVFGFRSLKRFSYKYEPRKLPDSLVSVLDGAFGEPVRLFLTKNLSF
jgi:hypothetical protein